MELVQWGALGIGAALVAWPAFQMMHGRPLLTFAFERTGDAARCVLVVNVYNPPVDNLALVQMGVRRDDASFSVSIEILDEAERPLIRYSEPRPEQAGGPGHFLLRGGHAPVALPIVAADAGSAKICHDAGPSAERDLKPGSYAVRITAWLGHRGASAHRILVVTQRRSDCYWADA